MKFLLLLLLQATFFTTINGQVLPHSELRNTLPTSILEYQVTASPQGITEENRYSQAQRIYRKNNPKMAGQIKTLTSDMKFLDKKYGIGKTNDII